MFKELNRTKLLCLFCFKSFVFYLTTSTPPLRRSKGWMISGLVFTFCRSRISPICSFRIKIINHL